jgi:hypothetical protein
MMQAAESRFGETCFASALRFSRSSSSRQKSWAAEGGDLDLGSYV